MRASLSITACAKRGDRMRELLCEVTADDDAVIEVGETAKSMQRADILTARLFIGTQGEGPEERVEIEVLATGKRGESAENTIRFGPGDCERK